MGIVLGVLAIIVTLGISYLMSNDKKNVNFKSLGIMLVLQLLITWFMFSTTIGQVIINGISALFNKLIEFGRAGIDFILGGIEVGEGGVFFFNVLLLIIFFATLLSVLTYLKILPFIIKYLGGLVSKVTGLPKIESFNGVNSIFFGQSEALIAIRSQFHHLTANRLFIVSASAMNSKTVGILTVFLTSFANFSSIGIMAGTVKGIDDKKAAIVSRFGLKLLISGILTSILSATVVGLFL
ncbi:Na+ dependent nucleoside transporter N-terminal domain-containing protein [Oceanobacillus chungangensis]|uniref:NupC/NupG family nucleoside CNT transporter n=1 Tax=Oceanobacillus chungangensis TaxID=1229152 RepID=A0A3D8PVR1_9BACI|nr:Na+ dependent nucleoside transporter N-terminal domain-containing protein [Oceanobacillus chungangensis]RDW19842.1 hypothetical protein CWR45_07210 [Oceanobacillus chungangensis]